jgi:hypothetical protein
MLQTEVPDLLRYMETSDPKPPIARTCFAYFVVRLTPTSALLSLFKFKHFSSDYAGTLRVWGVQ